MHSWLAAAAFSLKDDVRLSWLVLACNQQVASLVAHGTWRTRFTLPQDKGRSAAASSVSVRWSATSKTVYMHTPLASSMWRAKVVLHPGLRSKVSRRLSGQLPVRSCACAPAHQQLSPQTTMTAAVARAAAAAAAPPATVPTPGTPGPATGWLAVTNRRSPACNIHRAETNEHPGTWL